MKRSTNEANNRLCLCFRSNHQPIVKARQCACSLLAYILFLSGGTFYLDAPGYSYNLQNIETAAVAVDVGWMREDPIKETNGVTPRCKVVHYKKYCRTEGRDTMSAQSKTFFFFCHVPVQSPRLP